MAEYVGVIAVLLCVIHFLYQSIFLPTVRQAARDDLFKLRDELRAKMFEVQGDCNKNTLIAYKEIDDGINRSLNRLHLLNFTTFMKVTIAAQKSPEKYIKARERFNAMLDNSEDETPREIYCEVNKVLHHVLCMNSLMMNIYLLPFVLAIMLISSIYAKLKSGMDILVDSCIGREMSNTLSA